MELFAGGFSSVSAGLKENRTPKLILLYANIVSAYLFPFSLFSFSTGFIGTSGGGAFFFFLLRDLIKIFVSSVLTDPSAGS